MSKTSAGLLLWRRAPDLQVLLAHPGGPFYARRDEGVWTVPKGEPEPGEELLAAAYREFAEELGIAPPDGPTVALGTVTQKSGKVVSVWAVEGELDTSAVRPGTCEITVKGRVMTIPEVDRAEWFAPAVARVKILPAQQPFLDRLEALA